MSISFNCYYASDLKSVSTTHCQIEVLLDGLVSGIKNIKWEFTQEYIVIGRL